MKKHELLVPAGNIDCLYEAVYNGCDAVYLACKNFGARRFANNFTNEEILEAIRFCHLYGVKIYVTMNTLVKNSEVDAFIDQARFLHKNGVDALIVQDFGMICLLRKKFPNLEIHASTQANISSKDICKLYYDLGVKRVVFSRELSIDEIDSIDVPIEKEAFIHGALCISYSGCCLMSSMLGGRSGNRGECAGSCRIPYSLMENDKIIKNNKYLLSTKELNTSPKIDRLLDSSIYSFKIEGRMKSPLYVGFITNFYRHLIDKKEFDLKNETDKLKTIFNREFTLGRMFNTTDNDLMNISSPNHVGLDIGKVIGVTKNKIKIQLNKGYVLNQYDAIRFKNSNNGFVVNYLYDKNDRLINSSTDICYVDNKVDLLENDIVSKTHDYLLEQEYSKKEDKRKIPITIKVEAFVDKELVIEVGDSFDTISMKGSKVQKSINSPMTKDNIEKQLSKLGNTPFICDNFIINCDDNIFIQVKELNEIRRNLIEKLINIRQGRKKEFIENEFNFIKEDLNITGIKNSFFVKNKIQLEKCMLYDNSRIYVDDINLYNEYKNKYKDIYYAIPRETFSIKDSLLENNLVSDYCDYNGYNVIANYTFNIFNIYTLYFLKKLGIKTACLSVELTEEEILDFIDLYQKNIGKETFEIFGYGRIENMIIKGNIMNLITNKYDYYLVDIKNRKFPVYYDGVNTHILNYEKTNININKFKNSCIIRYDFYDEIENDIIKIVI
ncbi:MAG: U32 family peptidase [Bacilli bacterium]|nr:U32 family peptidase [Bacilli bacterium]